MTGGDPDPDDSAFPFVDADDNATFAKATSLTFSDSDVSRFSAEISDSADVDLFTLGTLSAGDRVVVDVQRTSGNLDAVAVIFDSSEFLQAFNDDREADASDINPRLDVILRGATTTYFVGVAALPGTGSSGLYRATVTITRGVGVPDPQPQTIFLDWNGGTGLTVENVGTFDLTPFDATDLGPYDGLTEQIKDRVQQIVREAYSGLNLVLLNSDDHVEPSSAHSTIIFGGSNRRAFAISAQIDTQNKDLNDDAIVFTRSYRLAFSATPTIEEISRAVGNTVAHEIGHLLGLVHTRSCESLMDSTCGNDRILDPQAFISAPLDPAVFPIGRQNDKQLIAWVLGMAGI